MSFHTVLCCDAPACWRQAPVTVPRPEVGWLTLSACDTEIHACSVRCARVILGELEREPAGPAEIVAAAPVSQR
ncbi:MAG: hypothetical protein U0556_09780 [Dehalococcoidia bacterium]